MDSGLVNNDIGTVWPNVMEPAGLTLAAGHYFLAFLNDGVAGC